jgi:4-amino-4-deoxy-L-arabinose transferase-like glycosyltransferase
VLILPAVSLLLTWLLVPSHLAGNESSDFASFYEPVARRLLAGDGLLTGGGGPAVRYPPGFPIILMGTFWIGGIIDVADAVMLRALALGCILSASWLLYRLSRTVWEGPAALLPSAVFGTYPLVLWLGKQPNSELPFMPLLFAAVLVFWRATLKPAMRPEAFLVVGVLSGLAMLVRPIAIALPVVFIVLLLAWHRDVNLQKRLLFAAALLAGTAMSVLPWQVWMHQRAGVVAPLSTGGAASMRDGLTFGIDTGAGRAGIHVPGRVSALMERTHLRYPELRTLGDIASHLYAEARSEPSAVAALLVIKAARSFYGTDSQRYEKHILILQATYLALLALASVHAWRRGRTSRRLVIMAWTVTGYFAAMNLLSLPLARYTAPSMGLLFLVLPALFTRQEVP